MYYIINVKYGTPSAGIDGTAYADNGEKMDSDGNRYIYLGLFILFVLLKGFYAACEYADIEVNDAKMKSAAEKDEKYLGLVKLIQNPSRLIVTFSTARNVFVILISVFAVIFVMNMNIAMNRFLLAVLTVVCVSVATTALTEILPKKLIGKKTEKFAMATVLPVKLLMMIMAPFSALSYAVSALFCFIFRVPFSAGKELVTEEEILMMVDAGNETGVIEESQREMINNIFEFGDSVVSDVMTHRKDLCAADVNSKIGHIVYLAINEGYSRIPVYEGTVDSIIGIINVKDLLCLVGCEHSEDFTVKQFMREVMYMPETCKCADAFENMTKNKAQMAVVVDEYGGTAGIVSMEDLLEEIVGNIQDEYDDEKADIIRIEDGVYTISGDANPEDVAETIGMELPEEHNYDTMSAMIVDLMGRIPDEDETPSVIYENVEFTVLLTEDNWISKIKAVCIKQDEETEE